MTHQKIKDMQPLAAALAIFAALPAELGIRHEPTEHDDWGYCHATVQAIPGALLRLTMRQDSGAGRGMFRAAISDSLPVPEGVTYGDMIGLESPTGNFTRDQSPEKVAQAIARRLFAHNAAAGYVAAVQKRHEDKRRAILHADNAVSLFGATVQAECGALGAPGVFVNYCPASASGARDISHSGAFHVKLWGGGNMPDVTLYGEGPGMPVRVRIDKGPSVSFATAAKICALVAFDKSTQD